MSFAIAQLAVDLSDYTLERLLGKGSYGAAYLATRTSTGEKVAVKLGLDPLEPDQQVSFMRELSILATNNHPATLQLLGFSLSPFPGSEEQGPVTITPLMPNDSLAAILKKTRRSPPAWWTPTVKSKIVFGIAAGMAYVNNQQVMHRDLKPDNVFLDANYEPVIADFGFSRSVTADLLNATVGIGSPLYMAPEIISKHDSGGGPTYDFRVDVYSYALILYALFNPDIVPTYDTGRKPRNVPELTRHVSEGRRYAHIKEIPDFYWGLIESCWAHGWESRPHFSDIIDLFRKDHQYALEGTNMDQLIAYEDKMLSFRTQRESPPIRTSGTAVPPPTAGQVLHGSVKRKLKF
jgi:serine/threonine protein kinase